MMRYLHPLSPKRARGPFAGGYAAAAAVGLIVLQVYLWFLTYGDWTLFNAEHFGQFYDAQATALLHGHWNVPHADIAPEAFVHNGKYYGYFGPAPAIPRMALNALFPAMAGCWSRLSALLAGAITLLASSLILVRAGKWMPASRANPSRQRGALTLWVLGIGLGSILLYLECRGFVYHEAGLWGDALALGAYYELLGFLLHGKTRPFAMACLLAFAAFFTRVTFGAGALAAIAILVLQTWRKRVPARSARTVALVGVTTCMLACAGFASINHAKFGTWLSAAPIEYYEQVARDPARRARTDGDWMRIGNVPTNFVAYFSPSTVHFDAHFPWFFVDDRIRVFSCSRMDGAGAAAGIPIAMPWLFGLAICGGVWIFFRRNAGSATMAAGVGSPAPSPWPLLAGAMAGSLPVFFHWAAEHRYEFEFFPALVIAASFGLQRLLAIRSEARWRVAACLLGAAIFWSMYANVALAVVHQRLRVYDVPQEKMSEFERWSTTIDRFLGTKLK